jgi:hypothetical protein
LIALLMPPVRAAENEVAAAPHYRAGGRWPRKRGGSASPLSSRFSTALQDLSQPEAALDKDQREQRRGFSTARSVALALRCAVLRCRWQSKTRINAGYPRSKKVRSAPRGEPAAREPGLGIVTRSQHHHSRSDLHPAVEIDHILIGYPDAARGNPTSDVFGLVGAVDAIQRVLAASVEV